MIMKELPSILVVEDQAAERKLAMDVLSAAGHAVRGAGSAVLAFAAIAEERPQVILLDMHLPGTDGMTMLRQLKSDPETSGIHIVTVTSYTESFSRAEAMAAGCAVYLLKPLNTRTLSDDLCAAVAGPQPGVSIS